MEYFYIFYFLYYIYFQNLLSLWTEKKFFYVIITAKGKNIMEVLVLGISFHFAPFLKNIQISLFTLDKKQIDSSVLLKISIVDGITR